MLTIEAPPVVFEPLFDRRGYYRSPVTLPAYRRGREPANKGRKFPAEVLEPDEVYALIRACGRGPAGLRNRALITIMWRAGLRISEALALLPKDVDLERGRVTVLHGKGDRRRVVAVDPAAAAIIEKWVDRRRRLGIPGSKPLFCVISRPTVGEPVGSAYVRDLLKRLAVKAGIEKRVSPHGLRHTYASHLAEQMPVTYVQAMLGHGSLATTERYISHLNPYRVIEAVRGVEWPDPTVQRRRPGPARAPRSSTDAQAPPPR